MTDIDTKLTVEVTILTGLDRGQLTLVFSLAL